MKPGVHRVRTLIATNRSFTLLLLALALLLRFVVPSGFMPVFEHGRVAILLCPGTSPAMALMSGPTVSEPAAASKAGHPLGHGQGGKLEAACPYAGLAMPVAGGADPVQLATALLYILALGFAATALSFVGSAFRLRPPARGPPILR